MVASDVTDEERQKQLELELRHAQKLESVGQLAAGIAHEINTPAQFVGDSLSFLANSFRDVQQVLAWIDREEPDVICLQEIKASRDKVPEPRVDVAGYHACWHGSAFPRTTR